MSRRTDMIRDLLQRGTEPLPEPVVEGLSSLIGETLDHLASVARSLEIIAREAERSRRDRGRP